MYDALFGVDGEEEDLWVDFITTFRHYSIDAWPTRFTHKWCDFLRSQGVHVGKGHEKSRAEALKRLWFRKSHVQTNSITALENDAHTAYAQPFTHLVSKPLYQATPDAGNLPRNSKHAPRLVPSMQVGQHTRKQENRIDREKSEIDEETLAHKTLYTTQNGTEAPHKDPTIIRIVNLAFSPISSVRDGLGLQELM